MLESLLETALAQSLEREGSSAKASRDFNRLERRLTHVRDIGLEREREIVSSAKVSQLARLRSSGRTSQVGLNAPDAVRGAAQNGLLRSPSWLLDSARALSVSACSIALERERVSIALERERVSPSSIRLERERPSSQVIGSSPRRSIPDLGEVEDPW